jgi:hypothetical protein
VRFSSVENAKKWEQAFEKARKYVLEHEAARILKEEARGCSSSQVASKLEGLALKEGVTAPAAGGNAA